MVIAHYSNEFKFLLIFLTLGLTSCKQSTDEAGPGNSISVTLQDSVSFNGLSDTLFSDSSSYLFLVENPAGSYDFQAYSFSDHTWYDIPSVLDRKFLPGPLHQGKLIYRRENIGGSLPFYLMGKSVDRGDVVPVSSLGQLEINNDGQLTSHILIPENVSLRLDRCNSFDDWFTVCDDFRSFIQEWLEKQYAPRRIRRVQWKPMDLKELAN